MLLIEKNSDQIPLKSKHLQTSLRIPSCGPSEGLLPSCGHGCGGNILRNYLLWLQ